MIRQPYSPPRRLLPWTNMRCMDLAAIRREIKERQREVPPLIPLRDRPFSFDLDTSVAGSFDKISVKQLPLRSPESRCVLSRQSIVMVMKTMGDTGRRSPTRGSAALSLRHHPHRSCNCDISLFDTSLSLSWIDLLHLGIASHSPAGRSAPQQAAIRGHFQVTDEYLVVLTVPEPVWLLQE